jgi:hypothetical protein
MNKKISVKSFLGKENGQSFIELLLLFPVLMILLSGVVEYGYMLNEYINLVDAAREGARFGSNADPYIRKVTTDCPVPNCVDLNFFIGIDQIVEGVNYQDTLIRIPTEFGALAPVRLNPDAGDDVVISFFSVLDGVPTREPNVEGWSYYEYLGYANHQVSRFTTAEIQSRLLDAAPNSGILIIEIFYHYDQVLKIWTVAGIPETIDVYGYSIMPLNAAEPEAAFQNMNSPYQSLLLASLMNFIRSDAQ